MADDESYSPFRLSLPQHVSWLTIILALLAFGTFIAITAEGRQSGIMPMGMGGAPAYEEPYGIDTSFDYYGEYGEVPPSPPPLHDMRSIAMVPYGTSSITDTRSFLTVSYSAEMRTRNVQKLADRVKTTIQEHDGRIDSESVSLQTGYVSFALPKNTYDAFRAKLEGLVVSKFLSVNVHAENKLPEVQNVEEQQEKIAEIIEDYRTSLQRITDDHANTVNFLQGQIDANTRELTALRAQTQTAQIQAQIQSVWDYLTDYKNRLHEENISYKDQVRSLEAQIKYYSDNSKSDLQEQKQEILDDVATVHGTVSLSWISLWDAARLYLPGYWIPTVFAILAFISYLWDRRRFEMV